MRVLMVAPPLSHSFYQKKRVIMSLGDGINKLIITTKLLGVAT
jgi:hypothetical protein